MAPIGIVLNFVAIPLAAVAVPGVLASLLIYPLWPGLAGALAAGAGLVLHLLELAGARSARQSPAATSVLEPGCGRRRVPGSLALVRRPLGHRAAATPWPRRCAGWSWAGAGALWVALVDAPRAASADSGSELALHFLDVGQGDGALHPHARPVIGCWWMPDPRTDGAMRVGGWWRRSLLRQGARSTRARWWSPTPTPTTWAACQSVLERFPAGVVIEPGDHVADPLYYAGFSTRSRRRAIPWHAGPPRASASRSTA